jgi:Ca2+-binding EF-hand superfamily protein
MSSALSGSLKRLRSFRESLHSNSLRILEHGSRFWARISDGDELRGQYQIKYSMTFRVLAAVIIGLDAACIGYQVDESLKSGYEHAPPTENWVAIWVAIEVCFVSYYTLEVVVRGWKERTAFLFGRERLWNLFDCLSVSASIVCLSLAKDFDVSTEYLRLVRITKGFRVLRVVRFSGTLRAMVASIISSMLHVLWAVCITFLVLYFFAVVIASEIAGFFQQTSVSSDSGPDVSDFLPYYASLLDTTLYLFMCITGGIDWETMAVPLLCVHPMLMLVFVMYIAFMTFGVLNVVVGIVVAKTQENADKDRELLTQAEVAQEREALKRMRDIFYEADQDGDNTLSWEEFVEYLADDKVAAFFRTVGLDVNVARALFQLLDADDSNAVNIEEFVHGCSRLKGYARSIDVNMLLYQTEKLQNQFLDCMDSLGRELTRLAEVHDLPPSELTRKKSRLSLRSSLFSAGSLGVPRVPTGFSSASSRVTSKRVFRQRALQQGLQGG